MMTAMPTIAVITSTIGKHSLERAIQSVQMQHYPCKHYVFVDGKQYADRVRCLEERYPDVVFTYLPMNTGADGWTNSSINAIAPFLVQEDVLCYLDDDNSYQAHHTQTIAQAFAQHDIVMAYTLRDFCDADGNKICGDNMESLGFWQRNNPIESVFHFQGRTLCSHIHVNRPFLVDTNCLGLSKSYAQHSSVYWVKQKQNDHYLFSQLLREQMPMLCTGQRTVNYLIDYDKFFGQKPESLTSEEYQEYSRAMLIAANQTPDHVLWETPTLWQNEELVVLAER